MIYEIVNDALLKEIKEQKFSCEKELQKLCEANLKQLINLEFIVSEFIVANFKLDTLAFDAQANAFVIIEYKNDRNASVIDQGYTYLSIMLNHKADFVLKYNHQFMQNKDIKDFDWSQSRVVFISPNFTKYQINSINFKDLPIELWKIKKHSNRTLTFEQVIATDASQSIKNIAPITETSATQQVSRVTKTYSERELIEGVSDNILDIYNELKDYILGLNDSIVLTPTKLYIGFNRGRKSIFSIEFQKNSLLLWLNINVHAINDPKKIIRDVSSISHHGNGDCEIKISDTKDIGYIEDILKDVVEQIVE
ncbi:MAG: hypothetical protein KHW59_00620 [Clostridiales bacterium]|nr:hypothetical protein [Clostridiales bacterium]